MGESPDRRFCREIAGDQAMAAEGNSVLQTLRDRGSG